MKINPDRPDFQRLIDPSTTTSKTDATFTDALASKSQPRTDGSQSINAQALTDPAKVGAAVDQAVKQLMEKEFAGMCAADSEQVAAWLRRDPLVRDALLKQITASSS